MNEHIHTNGHTSFGHLGQMQSGEHKSRVTEQAAAGEREEGSEILLDITLQRGREGGS